MVPKEKVVEWLNSVEWLSPDSISPQAQILISDHLSKIRSVIDVVSRGKGVSVVEAHGIAQTAGHDTPQGQGLLDALFSKVEFRNAPVRTALIANIVAAYCWELDLQLRALPNPWTPLLELYDMGYTTSTEDDPDFTGLTLLVGAKDGLTPYRIV